MKKCQHKAMFTWDWFQIDPVRKSVYMGLLWKRSGVDSKR